MNESFSDEDAFLKEALKEVPLPGDQLGGVDGRKYTIEALLGHGGMGHVFRARDEQLKRKVALKFVEDAPELQSEVLREGQALAKLEHPNIVEIITVDTWTRPSGGQRIPFLVMEYLEGETLAELLRPGPLKIERALRICEDIAKALAHAHCEKVVHRDLKPGNVFITTQGTVKLLDFGLAHFLAANATQESGRPRGGTPAYMAPEQYRGEEQDARTDIWAAGVVLYEMLTGSVPYAPTQLKELRAQILSPQGVPSVRERAPEVPEEVQALLEMALAKKPARRISSASQLQAEVRGLRARLFGFPREFSSAASQLQYVTLLCCHVGFLDRQGRWVEPEDDGELGAVFHQHCEQLIGPYGGTSFGGMGTEVLACFGCMQMREEDAERAARAAVFLIEHLPGLLQQQLPHLSLAGLAVRVGLHTGMVSVGCQTLQGEAVRPVARLANHAKAGEVLVGEPTARLLRKSYELVRLGTLDFPGRSGPSYMDLHRLGRQRKAEVRFDQAAADGGLSALVGREGELKRLLELWEQAFNGQGSIVLLSGEAGIGKSRLLQELREQVHPELALLLRVQCWPLPSASISHPATTLLQALVHLSREGTPSQHLRELEEQLATLKLPSEYALLLGPQLGLPIPQDSPVLRLAPARRREKTHEALAGLLLRVAHRRPVLAVIEDIHWADSELLEFLGVLMNRGREAALLVVLSTRKLQPSWPAYPWLHQLTLPSLPPEPAEALVRNAARGARLSEQTVRELVARTNGVPLFIEELTRMVLEQSTSRLLEPGALPRSIPITLQELLLARLDMRPLCQKALAQLAAVAGREFAAPLLAALTERDVTHLRHELAGLVEVGLFQQTREEVGEPWYQFRHALFQEAAYRTLKRSERQRHHQRIAQVLEQRFPKLVETKPELLAHHFMQAEQQAQAIPYWSRAGLLALNRRAIPEAVTYLNKAVKLIPSMTESSQGPGEELRALTALGFAQAQLQGFNSPAAAQIYERVWALLRQVPEVPPQLSASFWDIFAYHLERAEFPLCHAVATQVVTQADHHRTPELLSSGHLMMAIVNTHWGRMHSALEYSERAISHADLSLEQHRELVLRHPRGSPTHAFIYSSVMHLLAGRLAQARGYGEHALRLAESVGEPTTVMGVWAFMSLACMLRREHQQALSWAKKFIAEATKYGQPKHSWPHAIQGRVLAELGEPLEGLRLLREEVAGWRAHQLLAGLSYCLCMLAEVHAKLGQTYQALTVVHEALSWVQETGERVFEAELHRMHGELLRARGLERQAGHAFLRAIRTAREQGTLLFELRATVSLARWLWNHERPGTACRLLAGICARFEADDGSIDLKEARALMEKLS